MKALSGSLKLELAQFREVESFAQFDYEIDPQTQQQLTRGSRLVELLKQDQYVPKALNQQLVSLYLGVKGFLDTVDISLIKKVLLNITNYYTLLRFKFDNTLKVSDELFTLIFSKAESSFLNTKSALFDYLNFASLTFFVLKASYEKSVLFESKFFSFKAKRAFNPIEGFAEKLVGVALAI